MVLKNSYGAKGVGRDTDLNGMFCDSELSCVRERSYVLMRLTPSRFTCIGNESKPSKLMASCISLTNPSVDRDDFSFGIATSSPNNAVVQCTSRAMSSVASSTSSPQLNNRNCVDLTCCKLCTIFSTRICTQGLFLYRSPNVNVPMSTFLRKTIDEYKTCAT